MKKTIFVFAVALLVAISLPSLTNAAGLTELQINTILTLLQSFGVDQATVNNVQTSLLGGTPTGGGGGGATSATGGFCYNFTKPLRNGDTGAEVDALVKVLVTEGFITRASGTAERIRGEVFTDQVSSAVIDFQDKYGIDHTGNVGPLTRAKLNALYKCPTVNANKLPVISYINGGESGNLPAPTTLAVNESAKWSVQAYDPDGSSLTYTAAWGDNSPSSQVEKTSSGVNYGTTQGFSTTAEFTHAYTSAGTYMISFWVKDRNGGLMIKTHTVTVTASNNSANTPSPITVTSPNGGDDLRTGSVYPIKWTGNSQGRNISISLIDYTSGSRYLKQYNIRAGTQWGNNPQDKQNATDGSNYFEWTVPSNIPSGSNYKVFVADVTPNTSTSGNTDGSDTSFSISAPNNSNNTQPTIAVTSPNGGEAWKSGSTYRILWQPTIGYKTVLTLVGPDGYGADDLTQEVFPVGVTEHVWAIPTTPSRGLGTYQLIANLCKQENSDLYCLNASRASLSAETRVSFTIADTVSTIAVTSPIGGESWQEGRTYPITWSVRNLQGTQSIKLVNSNNVVIRTIASNITGGYYNWTIPQEFVTEASPGNFKILISSYDNIVSDYSDSFFRIYSGGRGVIQPSITVTSPRAGATWTLGSPQTINWTFANSNPGALVTVSLAKQGGAGDSAPINVAMNYSPSNTSITFTPKGGSITKSDGTVVPSLITPGSYKVRVVCQGDNPAGFRTCSGESGVITIAEAPVATPSITVTSPNGGTYKQGDIVPIQWQSQGMSGNDTLVIDILNSNKVSTRLLDNGLNTGSSLVPTRDTADLTPGQYYIRIRYANDPITGTAISDTSDFPFIITAPAVVSPVPTVTSVSPASGPYGTVITVKGTNFARTGNEIQFTLSGKGTVTFPGLASADGNTITFTAPNNTYGSYSIVVWNGSETSAVNSASKFYLTARPTISYVSPTAGPAGTRVTVVGTNFSTTQNDIQMTLFVDGVSKGTITIPGCIASDGTTNPNCPSSDSKTLTFVAQDYTYGDYTIVIFNGTEFTVPNATAKFNLTSPLRSNVSMNNEGGNSKSAQMASTLESIRVLLEEMRAALRQ